MIAVPACGCASSPPAKDSSVSMSDAGGDSAADAATDAGVASDAPSPDVVVPTDGPSSDASDALFCLADASVPNQCTMTCPAGQVCWDYSKHDPACSGTICTIPCCIDADCMAYAAQHGAAVQNNSRCGTDHLCNLVGVLGSFGCQ
jgi:hypothetical protein